MNRGDSGSLRISATDFGPIARANVELRPLTVFVGPSNTGKSYLAVLIYVLHRFFGGDPSPFVGLHGSRPFLLRRGASLLTEAARQGIHDVGREIARQVRKSDLGTASIPDEVARWIRSVFVAQEEQLGFDIRRCFAREDLGSLIRKGSNAAARIVVRRSGAEGPPFEHVLTVQSEGTSLRAAVPDSAPVGFKSGNPRDMEVLELLALMERASSRHGEEIDPWTRLRILEAVVLRHLAGPLRVPAHYLPADRAGVMHAHSVVVSATVEGAALAGLRPAPRTPMLSGVMADFLQQLLALGDLPPYVGRQTEDLGSRLEAHILDGSVRIDRSPAGNYPRFNYRPYGWKEDLPLMSASSMVSDLAPIVLYLRHVVRPGDLLIVEEPESHLHPEAQTALARQLVGLVASGFRILVTTHSDWMLHQFANQVRLSGLDEERREGLEDSPALRPDEFGAWRFRNMKRPRGSVVEEIPFDPEGGGLDSGYGDAANALYRTWAEIGNRIAEKKASQPS